MTAQIVIRELTSFRCLEFLAAGCLEDGAASLYDIGYILGLELHDFVGDETAVAAIDAFDRKTAENS